jgi:hypothetical protein
MEQMHDRRFVVAAGRLGRVFAYAMKVMTVSAAIMALGYRPSLVNAATVTIYPVVTGRLAVIGRVQDSRRRHVALLALAGWRRCARGRWG